MTIKYKTLLCRYISLEEKLKNKELYFLGESYGKLKLDKINNKIFILASNKVFVNNINKVFDEISEKCELVVEDNFEKAMLLINYIKFDIFIVEDISDNNNILFSNCAVCKTKYYIFPDTGVLFFKYHRWISGFLF